MLADLVGSLCAMRLPSDFACMIVVVENDSERHYTETVERLRSSGRFFDVVHVAEPALGIPVARNRAIDEAIAVGVNLVLFVDDDEVVAPDWLERIVGRYRESDLMMIGGPVVSRFEARPTTAWERDMQAAIAARYLRKQRVAEHAARNGREHKITVLTNNWLADIRLFTEHGLRFDPELRMSGGSDTRLFRDVRGKGLKTGWCVDAIVIETVPADRISVRYQYRRAIEQSRTSIRERVNRIGMIRSLVAMAPIAIFRSLHAAAAALALPLLGGRAALPMVRSAGWIVGLVTGLTGRRSTLYERTTGY